MKRLREDTVQKGKKTQKIDGGTEKGQEGGQKEDDTLSGTGQVCT